MNTNPPFFSRLYSKSALVIALVCAGFFFSCESGTPLPCEDCADENPDSVALAGGILTQSTGFTQRILQQIPPGLYGQIILKEHNEGFSIFDQLFVPSGTRYYGLGPVYYTQTCVRCHINSGRGRPVGESPYDPAMMLRISRSNNPGPNNGPDTVPGFGVVLQPLSWIGRQREGDIKVTYQSFGGTYADGESYQLRKPTYDVYRSTPPYIDLPPGTLKSARIATPLIGLGLLENIPEADILAIAADQAAGSDGISGKPNYVQNSQTLSKTLGRFGWKAGIATVYEHTAYDFNQAIGITSSLGIYARESCAGQPQADDIPFDDPEIGGSDLLSVSTFLKTSAVPGRRNMNADQVRRGQKLFADANCAKCHTPQQRTGVVEDAPKGIGIISHQTFYPYTDLLLHDMGEGLADGYREFDADGREWRTAPLWGIGMTEVIGTTNVYYLHDGRARTLEEAILWHGGEAQQSKDFFVRLPKSDREALIAFLRSL